jgi:hypothetical protein
VTLMLMLADGAEQRSEYFPVPAGADHQQFGASSSLHQHLCRVPLDGSGGHSVVIGHYASIGERGRQDLLGGDHRMKVADRRHGAEGRFPRELPGGHRMDLKATRGRLVKCPSERGQRSG